VTGSLTLHYDTDKTCLDDLLSIMRAHQYIDRSAGAIRTPDLQSGNVGNAALRLASRLGGILAEKAFERAVGAAVSALL
jgi:hypothetical protein